MQTYMKVLFGILILLKASLYATDNEALLKKFEQVAQKSMEDFKVPGMSIAIVKDDKVIFSRGFGVKEIGTSDKVDEHTVFQIGSVSKSFTSALVAKAVSDKKVKWTDKVIDHLSAFSLYDPWVTREFQIEDTMAQRSGLPSYAGDSQLFFGFTNDQIIHNIRYVAPISSFRTTFAYQNIFFNVAAKILELQTGLSWDKMVETMLFKPLGMTESSANWEGILNAKNVMKPHELNPRGFPEVIKDPDLIKNLYLYGPAGGVNSNCLDMAKWLSFQINNGSMNGKQIIAKEDMQTTHAAHVFIGDWNGFESYYCLGWILSLYHPCPLYWHNGGTNGCSSMCAFIPDEKLGIVILSNLSNTEVRHALALQFFDMYYDKPFFDWSKKLLEEQKAKDSAKKITAPTAPVPPQTYKNYTGTYHSPIYGDAIVIADQESLKMSLIDNKYQMVLKPFNHDTFRLIWKYDEQGNEGKVNFCFSMNGEPHQLYIDGFGPDKVGPFDFVKK